MANPRQRRKARSGVKKQTRSNKAKHKKVRVLGNALIAKAWDHSLTLEQNYLKLGLKSRLASLPGGIEKDLNKIQKEKEKKQKQEQEQEQEMENEEKLIKKSKKNSKLEPGTGRIIRDENGNVVRIEYGKYNIDSDESDDEEWKGFSDDDENKETTTDIVKELEEQAKNGITKPRVQSKREQEWIEKLILKHGDNYEGMFRDKKLNIYQQSIGDLKKRVLKWKKENGQ